MYRNFKFWKIRQLDRSPSFANGVEQVATVNFAKKEVPMVNKSLSEIRPGKELWNIKKRVIKLWIYSVWLPFLLFSVYKLLIMMKKRTIMHGVINKTYMEKFKLVI
jgi:hypothetical protein